MTEYEIIRDTEGNQVVIARDDAGFDGFVGNFDCFTEWASDADCQAFDQ